MRPMVDVLRWMGSVIVVWKCLAGGVPKTEYLSAKRKRRGKPTVADWVEHASVQRGIELFGLTRIIVCPYSKSASDPS